jgi:hypothetical protein
MAGSMAQVVQHLSSKTEALTLISSTWRKKKPKLEGNFHEEDHV